jgi:lipopolysaccharide transport system permease protein
MLLFFVMIGYYLVQDEMGILFHPNVNILLFPVLVLLMALLGLGLGLIITALTTKYRDLAFLITFGVQLMMYATTVIYPLSAAPAKYKWLIELNPMTGIIEAFRYGFLGQGEFTINTFGYSVAFTIVSLVLGVIIFNKTEKTFVDTV